tara:strand:- start:26 stop:490 length:465 start_codon:yes stop_codon:yes gene_type:complete
MATVYSDVMTDLTQDSPSEFTTTSNLGGRVRIAFATYEASSLASGDVINMFRLPNKARIVNGALSHDALGSSTTLSVGYAAHTDADGTAVSAAAAAYKAAAASTSAAKAEIAATIALGHGSVLNANEDGVTVTATMGGAAGTGTINVMMMYVVD